MARDIGAQLAQGVDARYVEIDSDFGHMASGADWARWAPALRAFFEELDRSRP